LGRTKLSMATARAVLAWYEHVAVLPIADCVRDRENALAAVIALDQFPRNMFPRHTPSIRHGRKSSRDCRLRDRDRRAHQCQATTTIKPIDASPLDGCVAADRSAEGCQCRARGPESPRHRRSGCFYVLSLHPENVFGRCNLRRSRVSFRISRVCSSQLQSRCNVRLPPSATGLRHGTAVRRFVSILLEK
jgi:hypothetical protein